MRLRSILPLVLFLTQVFTSDGVLARDDNKVYRLGILTPAAGPVQRIRDVALPELARLGFTEGKNLVVEAFRPGEYREAIALQPCSEEFRRQSVDRIECSLRMHFSDMARRPS